MEAFTNKFETFPPTAAEIYRKGITKKQIDDWTRLLSEESGETITWRISGEAYLLHTTGDMDKVRNVIGENPHRLERDPGGVVINTTGKTWYPQKDTPKKWTFESLRNLFSKKD
ncbi:hypothetical protein HN784_02750 [bacterium]|jgi:hypothetical protein|nr:hypothetical protein [bacterium]MBT4250814.1 hypothetical protein [bacterium]MBT4597526.1 hypothetical protein [bacterium]MBT6753992.1 hypothetical protein [bacterium]MBT7037550.1 hypothetical protein [bacterium]